MTPEQFIIEKAAQAVKELYGAEVPSSLLQVQVTRKEFEGDYTLVVFPLLKPTIATVAIINAMGYWNDYLLPSLVLTKKELYTIPIATQAFYGTYSTDIGLVMAALLLAMLPILILYIFLQRYIVEGVTSGAVKG